MNYNIIQCNPLQSHVQQLECNGVQWRWERARFISRWIIVGIEAFRLRNRVCPWNNCTLFVSICRSVPICLALSCIRRYRTSRTASSIEIKLSNSFWHHIWIRWMWFVAWHRQRAHSRAQTVNRLAVPHIKQFRFVIWFWLRAKRGKTAPQLYSNECEEEI